MTLLYALIGRPTAALMDGGPPPNLEEVLKAEHAMTAAYRARGLLRDLWLFAAGDGALLLCEADSLKAARAISDGYPMVQAGYITHDIHELSPQQAPTELP